MCWGFVWKEKEQKWTKVPITPRTWDYASSTDPRTWSTFDEARGTYGKHLEKLAGIGYVLAADDTFTGIDLDHCVDETGHIEPWAKAIVTALKTYAEYSPTRIGLRLFVKATLPPGRRKGGPFEVYKHGHFLTVTGHHLKDTPTTIEDRTAELAAIYTKMFPPSLTNGQLRQAPSHSSVIPDDDVLIEKACRASNGEKFQRLWRGDWNGYPSQSDADAALVSLLAFWTVDDASRMDRLFRRSGLFREKWNARRDVQTYGERTIAYVLRLPHECYRPEPPAAITTHSDGAEDEEAQADERATPLIFPKSAWRGPFAHYRDAMNGTSEAPDSAHFAALWAVATARLRRRVWIHYALTHYPNVYLVNFGGTGDSKTSAARQGLRLLPPSGTVKLLRVVGSAEALGDWMAQPEDGPPASHLLFIEELATLLTRGGWEGFTLLSFLTETFDAPDVYEVPFRKNPVKVLEPTPTLIAGTTPEWFWKSMREVNIHGGFGNRLFYLTGTPKPPIPMPTKADPVALNAVQQALDHLEMISPQEAVLDANAFARWK